MRRQHPITVLISVLLIEDDPNFWELVKSGLSRPDSTVQFDLHWAKSLSAAVSFLENSPRVDLILADLGLSDSAGPTTATKLAKLAEHIPFIVLSAEDRDSAIWEVMCHGAEDHIVKSELNLSWLVISIVNAIARHLARSVDFAPVSA